MKAVVRYRYGPPDVLAVAELPIPEPRDDEIRVKVMATTVNRTDCAILTARPFIMRFITGFLRPRYPVPGTDFAGVVDAVGSSVRSHSVGDRIFGFNDNGLSSQAEFLVVSASEALAEVPDDVDLDLAAASAEGAHYAINFLNKVELRPDDRVLIVGASGAIGSALLQLCRNAGARVSAVCGSNSTDLVRGLGAVRVYDYEREDFTATAERFHFVFDAVGKSSFRRCRHLLQSDGTYVSSELGAGLQNLILAVATPLLRGRRVAFPFPVDRHRSVAMIADRLASKQFAPLIDRDYGIAEVAEAYRYVMSGRKIGNVILRPWEHD